MKTKELSTRLNVLSAKTAIQFTQLLKTIIIGPLGRWKSWLKRSLCARLLVGDSELRHTAAEAAANFLGSNNNDWANHSLEAKPPPPFPQPQHDGSWWGDEEGRTSTQNSHVPEWEAEKPIIFIIGPVACSITLPAYSEITQPPTSDKREKSRRTWPWRC